MFKFFYLKYQKKLTILFFSIFFVFGILAVKDYGVSSDEYSSRIKGFVTLKYLGELVSTDYTQKIQKNKNIPRLENYSLKIYGVAFEAPASLLEVVFGIKDKKNQFLSRHYLNFLVFFISVIFFYKILKLRFNNLITPLLGSIILILSPRIFANSFYNNKDIVFLSLFIISSYYAIKFIKDQNFKNLFFFSIFIALTIDIRILAIFIPFLVFLINSLNNLVNKRFKKKFLLNLFSLFLVSIFIVFFWPYLWENPINNFIFAFKEMANFKIETYNLFFGEVINAKNVPWYFIPMWIIITTPILYLILFLAGAFLIFYNLSRGRIFQLEQNYYIDIFFISTLFVPLLAVIIFNSTLYNGWRQMYFIYPSIIFVCMVCINFFLNLRFILIKKIFFLVLALYFLNTFTWIIKNHPYQYVYFNKLINKDNIQNKFDLDYWGLSYKKNFEYILENDQRDKIKIFNLSQNKLFYHLFSVEEKLRQRFIVIKNIKDIEDADYIVNNFFMGKINRNDNYLKNFEIVNEILVDDYQINVLYKKVSF
tara:strand:- start:2557 stop:4164 length:1608 start_codon:yes stop_codon:yes gene_type:complete